MLVRLFVAAAVIIILVVVVAYVVTQITKNSAIQQQRRNVLYLDKQYQKHVRLASKYSKRKKVALAVLHIDQAQRYKTLLDAAVPELAEKARDADL